ncbi:PREDICTED: zinc finger protein 497-like [Branchiostoma belcheri]|uniref:Zinc finger protein 497-like n=1 Tax=Branchiostoma belcheri TaxID=7741 RepID=A0A6P4Y701_BRABE|nr:PREDICTED: zinc finger protein 497-like [Branchiostoma belcheri]
METQVPLPGTPMAVQTQPPPPQPSGKQLTLRFPEQSQSLVRSFRDFQQHGHFCDVTFRVQDELFRCHKVVLAARSSLFQSILSDANLQPSEAIQLDLIGANIFSALLSYMYTTEIVFTDNDREARDLLSAASLLQLHPVVEKLTQFLQDKNAVLQAESRALLAGENRPVRPEMVDEGTITDAAITLLPAAAQQGDDVHSRMFSEILSGGTTSKPAELSKGAEEVDQAASQPSTSTQQTDVPPEQPQYAEDEGEESDLDAGAIEDVSDWEPDGPPTPPVGKRRRGRPRKGEKRAARPRKRKRKEKGIPDWNLSKDQQAWVNQTLEKVEKRQKNCPDCEKVFKTPLDMRKHLIQVHSPEPLFRCQYCQMTFRTFLGISRHKKGHEKEEECIAAVEGAPETPQMERTKHQFTEEQKQWIRDTLEDVGKRQKNCPSCDKVFDTPAAMRKHLLHVHSKEPLFSCNICLAKLRTSSGLRRHSQTHIQNKQHICPMCAKTFSRRDHLVKHVRVHTGEKPYKCPDCERRFRTNWEVIQHKRYQICNTQGPFICKHCGLECRGAPSLRLHEAEHNEEKQFQCEVCGKGFALEENLKRHLTEHADIPSVRDTLNYKCSLCRFVTTSKQNLKHHELRHKGERSFLCDFCGQSFLTGTKLKRHKYIHMSELERPHHCQLCGKGFIQKNHLKIHMQKRHPEYGGRGPVPFTGQVAPQPQPAACSLAATFSNVLTVDLQQLVSSTHHQ